MIIGSSALLAVDIDNIDELMELDLEALMQLQITPTASLTKTTVRNRPVAMTIITKEDIRSSAARSLDELLEIYVPNLQIALHNFETQHLGLRGTISDRDDKYLLLVNNRVMNERAHFGALSERDLPMLQDINRVEIVRGPGGALYGPGALCMVINIMTDTAETFDGLELSSRIGAIDEFYTWEAKYGTKLPDGSGLFLYAGAAEQPGTQPEDVDYISGHFYDGTTGRDPATFGSLAGHNKAYRDLVKLKVHTHYQKDGLNVWIRYTRGGNHYNSDMVTRTLLQGKGYQQATVWAGHRFYFNDHLDIDYSLSADTLDRERVNNSDIYSHRQDEYHGRAVANWCPSEIFSLSAGSEFSYEEFGKESWGFPYGTYKSPYSMVWGTSTRMPEWNTNTYSLLGETQWRFAERWILFVGGRIDWHTFTKEMFSPRATVVHEMNEKDTLKAMASRSVRASTAEEMKKAYDDTRAKSKFEDMDNYELRWERQHTENTWFALSGYYNNRSVVAWDQGNSRVAPLGDMEIYGLEGEISYSSRNTRIVLSHGFSQLINFQLNDSSTSQFFTAEPYGYGNDLAGWHDHITKLFARYDLTEKLNVNGSYVVYWGSPGKKNLLQYVDDYPPGWGVWATPNFHDSAEPGHYLNLGLGYTYNEHLEITANAHHVLGWIDKKYNQKAASPMATWAGTSLLHYAPSLSFSLLYRH